MKRFLAFIMMAFSIYYLSCENNNDNEERLNNVLFPDLNFLTDVDCGKVILANGINPNHPVMDPYQVDYARIIEDTLLLGVSYGGGCRNHSFCLIAFNYYLETYPIQADLILSHNSNEDPCDAWISSELNIDMTPLKREFIERFGRADSLLLNIRIGRGEELNLIYKFN